MDYQARYEEWLEKLPEGDPLKAECYLPKVVDTLMKNEKATAEVLTSADRWFGVTYKEDKPGVMASIAELKKNGVYPDKLWE